MNKKQGHVLIELPNKSYCDGCPMIVLAVKSKCYGCITCRYEYWKTLKSITAKKIRRPKRCIDEREIR